MEKKKKSSKLPETLAAMAGRALKRSAKRAREIARMHGTAIYFTRNGKIISEKPTR